MGNVTEVKISANIDKLITAIDRAIAQHTRTSPMSLEDITGVLALMTGGCVGHVKTRHERRIFRQMVDANIDRGIERAIRESGESTIIMPSVRVQ